MFTNICDNVFFLILWKILKNQYQILKYLGENIFYNQFSEYIQLSSIGANGWENISV